MKNKVLAVIGGTIALFGLGYLIYVIIFGDATFMLGSGAEAASKDLNIGVIILMEALYALLLTIIFSKWAQIKTFSTGAKAGFIIGLLVGLCGSLELYATTTLTTAEGIAYSGITWAIRWAVAGGVIGWLLGRE